MPDLRLAIGVAPGSARSSTWRPSRACNTTRASARTTIASFNGPTGRCRRCKRSGRACRQPPAHCLDKTSQHADAGRPRGPMPQLFTDRELGAMLESSGLRVEQACGIHAITNLMPSPVLHRPRLPAALRPLYRALRWADSWVGSSRAMRAIAAHGVVLARRS